MSLMLIVNLCLCCLDQLLEPSDFGLKELDCILRGSLLNLKGSGELECRSKLTGGGFKVMNNVLWDVGPWL